MVLYLQLEPPQASMYPVLEFHQPRSRTADTLRSAPDRYIRFERHFWLIAVIKVKHSKAPPIHLQLDGQTDSMNRSLECTSIRFLKK